MARKEFLVVGYEGKVVPKDYLQKLFDQFKDEKKVLGFAVADKTEAGKRQITTLRDDDCEDTLEEVFEILETYKAFPRILYLADKPATIQTDDLLPIDMVSDHEDTNVCTLFALGTYPEKTGSSHAPAFHVAIEKVRPKLLALYDACEGKVDDFADELKSKLLGREMEGFGTSVCMAALVASEPPLTQGWVTTHAAGKHCDWGFASDPLEPLAVTEAPKGKGSLLDRMKGKPGGSQPVTGTADKPVVVVPEKVTEPPAELQPGIEGLDYVQCPTGLTRKEAKNWYKRECGFIPDVGANQSIHKARPRVPRMKGKGMEAIKQVKAASTAAAPVVEMVKDTTVHHLPTKIPNAARATADTPLPKEPIHQDQVPEQFKIPTGEMKFLTKGFINIPTVKKVFDDTNEEISIFGEMEENRPSLNLQMGLDGGIERWNNMPGVMLRNLARVAPMAAVQLLEEYRFHFLKMSEAKGKVVVKATTADPTPAPAPVVHPKEDVTKPEVAKPATSTASASTPPKKASSMFSNMRKRA